MVERNLPSETANGIVNTLTAGKHEIRGCRAREKETKGDFEKLSIHAPRHLPLNQQFNDNGRFWNYNSSRNRKEGLKMNLKEAFRYQNKLQALMNEAESILEKDANVTRVENTHLRSKALSGAQDETVAVDPDTEFSDQITEVACFLVHLLEEKEKLFAAIKEAKAEMPIDFDGGVSLNAARQDVARIFKHMNDLRSTEQLITNGGVGYTFNAEGNQVSYRCDLKKVTRINFMRDKVQSMLKALNKKADEISTQVDVCLVTSKVDYEPPYDVNTSFADAFRSFAPKKGADESGDAGE